MQLAPLVTVDGRTEKMPGIPTSWTSTSSLAMLQLGTKLVVMHEKAEDAMRPVQIAGRSSSHFTRVAVIFAHELGVPFELVAINGMTSTDSAAYADNPALKMPTLRTGSSLVFGAENICRKLADLAGTKLHVVWPEQVREDVVRNAQELVWHGMAAQVQLVFGTIVAKLPADNIYFAKSRDGFEGALRWLDSNLASALRALPSPRDLSLFEVTLFCLMDHIAFRGTVPVEPYPALMQFTADFATRPSAQRTQYRYDSPP